MKLSRIKNDTANLSHDAKMVLMRKLLLEAADLAQDNIIPVNADHKQYVEDVHKEEAGTLLKALLLLAGSAGILAILASRGKKFIDKKAEEEKAKFEADRRELYRRLSTIKGRA